MASSPAEAASAGGRPVVLGNLDMVRPLALAGHRCVLIGRGGNGARHSRHVDRMFDLEHPRVVDELVTWAGDEAQPPVVLVAHDLGLMFTSRHRERLASAMDLTLTTAAVLDDLVDKLRFQRLGERLGLPVPRARPLVDPAELDQVLAGLGFPLIVKPARRDLWSGVMDREKAVLVHRPDDLRRLLEVLAPAGPIPLLLQELVPGGEERIESYHAYRSRSGVVLGEFTGRKIRTRPARFGLSTALVTTDAPEVRALGREVIERIDLPGPVKIDFKRDDAGALRLFEVNPRFTLWAHPGALAGVNLPDLALRDLAGETLRPGPPGRPGVRWCDVIEDRAAVRDGGGSTTRWLGFMLRTPARSSGHLDDPVPFLRSVLWPRIARRLR